MSQEERIKSLCAQAGIDYETALEEFKSLREKNFTEAVAFQMWHSRNSFLLAQVTGDFEGVVLAYNSKGKRMYKKGETRGDDDWKASKADVREVEPERTWIHDMTLGVLVDGKVVIADAGMFDDPAKDYQDPILSGMVEPTPGMEVSLKGYSLGERKGQPTLRPRKGSKAEVTAPGKVAEKIWESVPAVDIADVREKGLSKDTVFKGLVVEVKVIKNDETQRQTAFVSLSTAKEVPDSLPLKDLDSFMGAIDLPYWPDGDEVLDEDDLNKAFQGKAVKFSARIWPVKEQGELTGELKGRINTLGG